MFTILVDRLPNGSFVVRQSCPWQDSTIVLDDCYAELSDALEGARVALTATLELGGKCEGVSLSANIASQLGYLCPKQTVFIFADYILATDWRTAVCC